jgi:molecular chaperone GrpE
MSKHGKHSEHSDKTPHAMPAGQASQAGAAPLPDVRDGGLPANDNPSEVVAKLEAERTDLKDKLLRALADLENQRRRSERELADARSYAIAKFAGDMLDVADNMGRAVAAIPMEARQAGDATLKGLVEGAELTERAMLKALEKHGVKRLNPIGEKFDPHFHQAIFEVPDPSLPAGTVAQVVQVGYSIGDRVLRPAMVGVARGGPKASAPTEAGATVDKTV